MLVTLLSAQGSVVVTCLSDVADNDATPSSVFMLDSQEGHHPFTPETGQPRRQNEANRTLLFWMVVGGWW